MSCGIADLGCVSLILWAFEEREIVFTLLESVFGARLHTGVDGLIGCDVMDVGEWMGKCVFRIDVVTEIISLRGVANRLQDVGLYDWLLGMGRLFTGIFVQGSGMSVDLRMECAGYANGTIVVATGGVMGCSLARISIRM